MTVRHALTVVPRPKMDAPSLLAATCACGNYASGPSTRNGALTAGSQHVADANVNDAAETLAAGLAWMFDTVQPDGALCHHLGFTMAPGDRYIGFIPDARFPIVTMSLAYPEYDGKGGLTNPLTKQDVTALVGHLTGTGRVFRELWNGRGTETVSIALAGHVHPTLLAAVERYRNGCREHGGSVFCSRQQEPPCSWFADGHRLLVKPSWPRLRDQAVGGDECTTCRGRLAHKAWCDTLDGRGDL